MDSVERLLRSTVEELDRLLDARHVMGTPIDRDGTTIIPLVSYGFGFGAGGNAGESPGGGAGAGGGIRPIGAIIIDEGGARVEPVQTMGGTIAGLIARTAEKMVDRVSAGKPAPEAPEAPSTSGPPEAT